MISRCLVVFIMVLTGCATPGNYAPVRSYHRDLVNSKKEYIVKKGDTLYSIGFRSRQRYQQLALWNKISAPYHLKVGQKIKLFKPKVKIKRKLASNVRHKNHAKKRASSHKNRSIRKKRRPASQKTSTNSEDNKKVLKLVCQWPIKKKILKTFSQTGYKGIDISGAVGQKVRSACSGKVVYSGSALHGYGNLLIIKHNHLFLSAYANNRHVFVKEGQHVKKGQVIAEVGRVRGKQASLHFEIRKNGKPVNPVNYLPE